MQFFVQLNELGTTVLIASHDLDLIRRLGRRVMVLDDGRLVDEVEARPERSE